MKIAALVIGGISVLLGGLWLLQGLGLVQIDPVLCIANCAPLEGPSASWAIVGGIVMAVGAVVLWYGVQLR